MSLRQRIIGVYFSRGVIVPTATRIELAEPYSSDRRATRPKESDTTGDEGKGR